MNRIIIWSLCVLIAGYAFAADEVLDRFKNVEDEIAWRTISKEEISDFYQPWEMESINDNPFLPEVNATCAFYKSRLTNCCVGSFSRHGQLRRDYTTCSATVANYFSMPEFTSEYSDKRTFRNMKDILEILDGKYVLSTLGDSVGNQMASAFECSWALQEDVVSHNKVKAMQNPNHWDIGLNLRMQFNVTVNGVPNIMYQDNSYIPDRQFAALDQLMNMSDIIVMNYGVHWRYTQQNDYAIMITEVLTRARGFVLSQGKYSSGGNQVPSTTEQLVVNFMAPLLGNF